jgi:hypothetical protein
MYDLYGKMMVVMGLDLKIKEEIINKRKEKN